MVGGRWEWSVLDLMERGDCGTRRADGGISVGAEEGGVRLLYGPPWRLSQGAHRLSIHCRTGPPKIGAAVVLGVEIIADNRVQAAWRDFTAQELAAGSGEVDFVVSPKLSRDAGGAFFEFRLYHFGNADLIVSDIVLRRLTAGLGRNSTRRWRLTGRIDPRRASPPDADGFVAVPRRAPAGQFLRQLGPVVGLPSARYQLRFRCRADSVRSARCPVLSVEIVNGDVSHQAYFYPAELAAGQGSVDFAVPSEFGLEGGTPAPIEVRFIHLRNAALAIGAIELVPIDEEGVRPPAEAGSRYPPAPHSDPGALPMRRQDLAADPLHVSLMPGRVTVEVSAQGGGPEAGAASALSLELRPGDGERRPWHRLMFGRRAAQTAAGRSARWDFAARDLRAGAAAVEFDVPGAWSERDGGEASVEVRIVDRSRSDLALTKINLKKIRQNSQKDLIIVGNCHAAMIREGFQGIPALRRYFRARYYEMKLPEHFHEEARRDLQNCDLVVVQDIGDWEDCPMRGWVSGRAETIMFPCIRLASLWPFDHCNGPTDIHAFERSAPNFTFPYLDGLLARLRTEIPDPERRFQAYRSLNFGGIVNYVRAHQFETRRMLALDKKYDCEIGQFILDRFQSEQLFYTTNRPNRRIFELLMANIMRSLGITGDIPPLAVLDQFRVLQVPVHPTVADALGVLWATPQRRYCFRQVELTWEEYVRRYIDLYG